MLSVFTPENKVQKLAYQKWGVKDPESFAKKMKSKVKRGTARTIWLAGSPYHRPTILKAVADALETTVDDLFFK